MTSAHRWSALLSGLFATLWFASGMVMLFHAYPSVTDADRLRYNAPLGLPLALDHPPVAVPMATSVRWFIRAGMLTVEREGVPPAPRPVFSPEAAAREVQRAWEDGGARVVEFVTEPDQWTLYPSMVRMLPAYRIVTSDDTYVYLSVHGEVVQVASPRQRRWAWLGAIPHWLYLRALVTHREVWREVVLVISGLGVAATVSGLVIGIWSLRRRRSPFSRRWMRVHHWCGLGFGAVTFS